METMTSRLPKVFKIYGIVFISYCFCVSFAFGQQVPVSVMKIPSRPNPDAGPTKVEVGIWLIDIDSVDSAQQNFVANVAVILKWKDPRLAHGSGSPKRYPAIDVWTPQVLIANEIGLVRKTLPEILEVKGDGTVTYRQRYVGPFSQPMKLHDFPFDRHTFTIQLASVQASPDEIVFIPRDDFIVAGLKDASGIASNISLPDWDIIDYYARSAPYELAPQKVLAGYKFEFVAKRHSGHYVLKVIFPLALIVFMSWAVFWIDPENFSTQVNVAITSMLTLIAYRFAVDAMIPKVSYMTKLDMFIFVSMILVFLSFLQVNVTGHFALRKRKALAGKIDLACRILFPAAFLLASLYSFGFEASM
jgi:hypothetical protein